MDQTTEINVVLWEVTRQKVCECSIQSNRAFSCQLHFNVSFSHMKVKISESIIWIMMTFVLFWLDNFVLYKVKCSEHYKMHSCTGFRPTGRCAPNDKYRINIQDPEQALPAYYSWAQIQINRLQSSLGLNKHFQWMLKTQIQHKVLRGWVMSTGLLEECNACACRVK